MIPCGYKYHVILHMHRVQSTIPIYVTLYGEIHTYIVIVYTVGMGLQHESEFHSPQGASFHQGGSLLHIPKLSLCSLVCMQTFFEAPSNLFFSFRWVFFTYVFMGCESMWCFFWFFGIVTFKQIWLLLTLLPASTRETASRTMDEWEKSGAALSWQSHVLGAFLEFLKDSLQIACDETLKLFC